MRKTDEQHYYELKRFLVEHWKPSWGLAEFVAVGVARDQIRKLAFKPRENLQNHN